MAIQLAKIKGAEVCTTVGGADKARLVRQLGADEPILYKQTDFVQATLNWTAGKGVDLAFDTVGDKTFFDTCGAVRIYGDIVTGEFENCSSPESASGVGTDANPYVGGGYRPSGAASRNTPSMCHLD